MPDRSFGDLDEIHHFQDESRGATDAVLFEGAPLTRPLRGELSVCVVRPLKEGAMTTEKLKRTPRPGGGGSFEDGKSASSAHQAGAIVTVEAAAKVTPEQGAKAADAVKRARRQSAQTVTQTRPPAETAL